MAAGSGDPVTFDPTDHSYRRGGIRLPSVTQVLGLAGLTDTGRRDEFAMQRGSAVHLACALDDRGTLNEVQLDDRLRPYLRAWRAFRKQSGFAVEQAEALVVSEAYGYAGTLDRFGRIGRFSTVLEIKTGMEPPRWTGLQLAGYTLAMGSKVGLSARRMCVSLRPDGEFRIHEYADPTEYAVFLSAVQVAMWKLSSGAASLEQRKESA